MPKAVRDHLRDAGNIFVGLGNIEVMSDPRKSQFTGMMGTQLRLEMGEVSE